MRINWSDKKLENVIDKAAKRLPAVPLDNIKYRRQAVSKMCENARNIISVVCSRILANKRISYKGYFKPHNWWSPSCYIARDRQRA